MAPSQFTNERLMIRGVIKVNIKLTCVSQNYAQEMLKTHTTTITQQAARRLSLCINSQGVGTHTKDAFSTG